MKIGLQTWGSDGAAAARVMYKVANHGIVIIAPRFCGSSTFHSPREKNGLMARLFQSDCQGNKRNDVVRRLETGSVCLPQGEIIRAR